MNKKILLIHDNPEEIDQIQKILNKMILTHAIFIAKNGNEAINVLMGSSTNPGENFPNEGKIRPDIILLNNDLPDMIGIDFLRIVRNYYSLSEIRIFLLITSVNHADRLIFEELRVSGFLQRPLDETLNAGNLEILRSELQQKNKNLTLVFLVNLKTKLSTNIASTTKTITNARRFLLNSTYSVGAKISICAASAMIIGGAAYYATKKKSYTTQTVYERTVKPASVPAVESKFMGETFIKLSQDKEIITNQKNNTIPIVTEEESVSQEPGSSKGNVTTFNEHQLRIKITEEKDSLAK